MVSQSLIPAYYIFEIFKHKSNQKFKKVILLSANPIIINDSSLTSTTYILLLLLIAIISITIVMHTMKRTFCVWCFYTSQCTEAEWSPLQAHFNVLIQYSMVGCSFQIIAQSWFSLYINVSHRQFCNPLALQSSTFSQVFEASTNGQRTWRDQHCTELNEAKWINGAIRERLAWRWWWHVTSYLWKRRHKIPQGSLNSLHLIILLGIDFNLEHLFRCVHHDILRFTVTRKLVCRHFLK